MGPWISVKDRLPDVQRRYLVANEDGTLAVATLCRLNRLASFHGWYYGLDTGATGIKLHPTHWMELPAPPEGQAIPVPSEPSPGR